MIRTVCIASLAMALASCALTRGPDTTTILRLTVEVPEGPGLLQTVAVSVAPVTARGVSGQRRYAYIDRAAPAEIRQAATLFWEEPPPVVTQRALIAALRARFASVVGSEVGAESEQRVVARLERFEEVSGGGRGARAVVDFETTVIRAERKPASVTGRYCAAVPIAGGAPTERAHAFGQALGQAALAFAADLAAGRAGSTSCED